MSPCPYTGALDAFDPEFRTERLYWPEGEKDCDTLGPKGYLHSRSVARAMVCQHEIDEYLKGRDIVILADNDVGGQKHANKKAERAPLRGSDHARIVNFSELPPRVMSVTILQTARRIADLYGELSKRTVWAPQTSDPTKRDGGCAVISASDLKIKIFNPFGIAVPGYIPEASPYLPASQKLENPGCSTMCALRAQRPFRPG